MYVFYVRRNLISDLTQVVQQYNTVHLTGLYCQNSRQLQFFSERIHNLFVNILTSTFVSNWLLLYFIISCLCFQNCNKFLNSQLQLLIFLIQCLYAILCFNMMSVLEVLLPRFSCFFVQYCQNFNLVFLIIQINLDLLV